MANPQVIKSNLQRPSIFSSAYVENRNSAISPIPSSKTCFAYCAKPEPAQQAKTQCPSLFLQKFTQMVFFADCTAPGPILFLYKNTSSIYFSGDITDMVFLLSVQDLTWYNKQKTITICNQPGSQVTLK